MTRFDRRTVIIGTGSCIPERRIPNADFLDHQFFLGRDAPLDKADNPSIVGKFQEITDIAERRYADDGVVTTDLALAAGAKALEDSRIDRESLDYVIVAHNFGDVRPGDGRLDICPSLAARVKQRLEIVNPSCVAYDLPFGCPGWIQGVIQASYYLGSGDASRALVVGAETLSRVLDPHDRDSMLYADGAGAAVLEAVDGPDPVGILSHAARSDTIRHAGLIWMGGSYESKLEDDRLFLKMQGRKLYEYALNHVPGLVKESLDRAGLSLGDVKKILLHQANNKMDEAIVKRLFRLYGERTVPDGVMPMTISWLGNSSVATVPTLLDLMLRREFDGQTLESDDVVVLASVGAGMNVNSVVYRFP